MKSKSKAFTLIELLLVVAIVSLISSIAVAALTEARNKARYAKFDKEFAELRTVIALYKVDNGDYPSEVVVGNDVADVVTQLFTAGYFPVSEIETPLEHVLGPVYQSDEITNYATCGTAAQSGSDFALTFQTPSGISNLPQMYYQGVIQPGFYCIEI